MTLAVVGATRAAPARLGHGLRLTPATLSRDVAPLVVAGCSAAAALARGRRDGGCLRTSSGGTAAVAAARRRRGGRVERAAEAATTTKAAEEVGEEEFEPGGELGPILEKLLRRGEGDINVIQVGACDGDFCGETSNDPLQPLLGRPRLRALLLEPSPQVFRMLQDNVRRHFGGAPHIRLMNAAVSHVVSGQIPFYQVSPDIVRYRPNTPHWARFQLSSMDRRHVLKHHVYLGLSEEEFAPYIQQVDVVSLMPADLLREAALEPASVHALVVDAEGFDALIVMAFLRVPDFRPAAVIFEEHHQSNDDLRELLELLERLGYRLERMSPERREDMKLNILAWRL